MEILEVENLTLNSDNLDEYLVVPDDSTLEHVKYPLSMGRLDCIWITKDRLIYSVDNVLPFIRLTQESYDALGEVNYGTLYLIIDSDSNITKMYYNEKEYSKDQGMQLIGNCKLFIDENGVIYSDISTKQARLILDDEFVIESQTGNATTIDTENSDV